jgi:hypothetical protein
MQADAIVRDAEVLPIGADKWPMKPFQRANPQERVLPPELLQFWAMFPDAKAEALAAERNTWINDTYQVLIQEIPDSKPAMLHLNIRRIDNAPIHDWRDIQTIKNLLVGPENDGFELYPAESRKQDTCNKYHLYVLKNVAEKINIGAFYRTVTNKTPVGKQRPYIGF